jgi:hypothetical protein
VSGIYEAVVVLEDGTTYRAFPVSSSVMAVTEDTLPGVLEYVLFDESSPLSSAPEHLEMALRMYVHENLRGMEIVSSSLQVRTF